MDVGTVRVNGERGDTVDEGRKSTNRREWDIQLLKWAKEFQSEEPDVTETLVAAHPGSYRGRFVRDQAGSRSRRCRDSQMNRLTEPKDVRGGDTGSTCADIERFGQFDELCPGRVRSTKKDRHLDANAGISTSRGILRAAPVFELLET